MLVKLISYQYIYIYIYIYIYMLLVVVYRIAVTILQNAKLQPSGR
jgi:hypothetical protein